jgi:hypothetical protein
MATTRGYLNALDVRSGAGYWRNKPRWLCANCYTRRMARKLKPSEARRMAAQRKTKAGGRHKKPTPCPKCGIECPGYRLAQVHCS